MDMHSPAYDVHKNSISSLESTFRESLHIRDDQKSEHASPRDADCDVAKVDLSEDIKYLQTNPKKKCLKKCATFPSKIKMPASSSDEEVVEDDTSLTEHGYSRSISVPTPLELVSAMKGSRDKQGESRMKLTVKWAPDVYDPVPTSLSHTVDKSKKQHKHRNKKTEKKNVKKSRKGNSSRGGSGKDKKQIRKMAWTSNLCYESLDSRHKVIAASTELDVLDVASHDSHCGTSFLRKSATQLHYSVAEAQ